MLAGALVSTAIYIVITAWIGRDVLAALGTTIANDPGDPILNAAILAWNALQVPWTDAWFQFPIFHPTPNALVLSEHLLGVSVVATPIYWITGNPLTAYNAALLLSYPLSGLTMFLLVRRLTGSAAAGFLSGLAFAFAPYRASQLPHIQMLATFWAPLALLGLHGFLEAGPPAAESPAGPPSAGPALHYTVIVQGTPPYTVIVHRGPGAASRIFRGPGYRQPFEASALRRSTGSWRAARASGGLFRIDTVIPRTKQVGGREARQPLRGQSGDETGRDAVIALLDQRVDAAVW